MLRKFLLAPAVLLVASLNALGQDANKVGYVYCATGNQYVYLYDSLSRFNVLANVKCGERLDILGSENGYVMVRTADGKQGYVPLAAITSTPPANAPAARASGTSLSTPGAPVDTSSPVGRLEPPRYVRSTEVFAGYSYLNVDENGLTSRQSFNGWETGVAVEVNRWLAGEGSVAGYFKRYNLGLFGNNITVRVQDFSFLGGPRINFRRFRPAFVHALVGLDHSRATVSGFSGSASENSIAAAIGGGVRWRIADQWLVRTSADYVLTRHTATTSRVTQNNIRVSAGVVYTFHTRNEY